jgi:hypothetical protein
MLTCACCPVNRGQAGRILLREDTTAIQVQLVDDQVSIAIDRVARDRYLRAADGRQLPQTSKHELIAAMLAAGRPTRPPRPRGRRLSGSR